MRFTPLHPRFGALVEGFDLVGGGTAGEIAELRAAYDRHHMLLFRESPRLSPERHVEIAGWFGPPGPMGDGGRLATTLDNAEPAGSFVLPFHSDLTYTEVPVKCILLHPIELPEAPTSTTFVSGIAAWAGLPAALKETVAGLRARHHYRRSLVLHDTPEMWEEQPVRLVHPRTGEPVLFVTEHHSDRIAGMDAAAGQALIEELFGHLYAPAARYEHVWRLHDLLVWDNLALQHARTRHSDPGEGRRVMQRVALSEAAYGELVERARRKRAA